VIEQQLECLAAGGINILPATEISTHFVLERDGFIVLVERTADGFGRVGSAGLLTDHGFGALVWRGSQAFFIARNFEQPATAQQVSELRSFSGIVKNCIEG
jgi:hypothetical protein